MIDDYDQKWKHTPAQFEINRKFARAHNPTDDSMTVVPDIYDNYKRQVNAYGMSSKCPELMAEIKGLVPWMHEHKIHLEVVYIRSEANLTDASSPSRQRGFDMLSLYQSMQQELLDLVEVNLDTQVCTDPFACRQSTVTPRFATSLHCRHRSAFNGLFLDWSPVFTL